MTEKALVDALEAQLASTEADGTALITRLEALTLRVKALEDARPTAQSSDDVLLVYSDKMPADDPTLKADIEAYNVVGAALVARLQARRT